MKWSNRWLGVLSALWMALASCSGTDPFAATRAPVTPTRTPLPLLTLAPRTQFSLPGRTQGNPDARVTLVVFADFQCPYSQQFAREVLPRLAGEYITSGKISFTCKYFPVIDEGCFGKLHWATYAAGCTNDRGSSGSITVNCTPNSAAQASAHSRVTTSNCTPPV